MKNVKRNADRRARRKLRRLKNMRYSKYLTTKHWQEIRKEVYRRAGYKCEECEVSNVTLYAHHKTYEHRGEEMEHLEDLRCLCKECHDKEHEGDDKRNDYPKAIAISEKDLAYIDSIKKKKSKAGMLETIIKTYKNKTDEYIKI